MQKSSGLQSNLLHRHEEINSILDLTEDPGNPLQSPKLFLVTVFCGGARNLF